MRRRSSLLSIEFVVLLTLLFGGVESFIKSRYACQGEKLRIRCKSTNIIQIYSANYGRTEPGSSICPNENIGSTTCKSAEALNIVIKKCTNRARCNVKADNSMFPDPCPDTFKYLDIVYGCVPRPETMTARPPPSRRRRKSTTTTASWIITTEPTTTPTPLPTTNATLNPIIHTPNSTHNTSTNITTTKPTVPSIFVVTSEPTSVTPSMSTTTAEPPEVSGYVQRGETTFMNLVVSFYLTYIILAGQPKYVLILFLSGVAIATILLLVLLLGLHLRGRRSKKYEVETEKDIDPHDEDDDDDDDDQDDDEHDDGVHDDEEDESDDENKNVMIEIQGDNEETKQISVKPGDIIIIDSKDVDNDDSEDLGYMSEIVRYYNSRNMVQDDGKQSLTCETPSINSIPNSEGDKRELPYDNVPQSNGVCVT